VFRNAGRVLVSGGFDPSEGYHFYRPLGGGVEPGETSRDALVREIGEELGLEATDLRPLGVLENIFALEGELGHEIVFVYDGRFTDHSVYGRPRLDDLESKGERDGIAWRSIDFFDDNRRLVPKGLRELLEADPGSQEKA